MNALISVTSIDLVGPSAIAIKRLLGYTELLANALKQPIDSYVKSLRLTHVLIEGLFRGKLVVTTASAARQ